MSKHVDRILDVIDAGLQSSRESSYGRDRAGRCWRCLVAATDTADDLCDLCGRAMRGEIEYDPDAPLQGPMLPNGHRRVDGFIVMLATPTAAGDLYDRLMAIDAEPGIDEVEVWMTPLGLEQLLADVMAGEFVLDHDGGELDLGIVRRDDSGARNNIAMFMESWTAMNPAVTPQDIIRGATGP